MPRKKTTMSREEVERVLKYVSGHWIDLFRFQWETACRIGEALHLTNECVDFPNVAFQEHKLPCGGIWKPKLPSSVRKLRLPPECETLVDTASRVPVEFVFYPSREKAPTLRAALNALQGAAEKAGVQVYHKRKGELIPRLVGTHDLRRARIAQALAAGADPNTVARAVGHASLHTTVQYVVDTPMLAALPSSFADAIDNPVVAEWAAAFRPKKW